MKLIVKSFVFAIFFQGAFDYTVAQCSMTNVTTECLDQLGQGGAFTEPVQFRSQNATSQNVTISVGIGDVAFGWLNLKRRMYNDQIIGPTLTVKPGDILNVHFVNTLSNENNEDTHINTTNLHTHGLHISSQDPQDNVLVRVEPGETYNYIYQIHPQNAPGTNWYHAHIHGTTLFQVHSGLSGMLIVEDSVADMAPELAAVSCPDNCDKDIQMLFQGVLTYNDFAGFGGLQESEKDYEGFKNDQYDLVQGGTLSDFLGENLYKYTTNGQVEPELVMETEQMYRFRMGNAGGRDTLEINIVDESDQPTNLCTIREIALDGVYLDAPRLLHDSQSILAPAARIDWMIKCNTEGIYYLKSNPSDNQLSSVGRINRYDGNLMRLNVSGVPVSTQNFPTTLPARPEYMSDLSKKTQSEIEGRFVVEMSPQEHLNREHWSEPLNYRYKMEVGTLQEWHIVNADGNFSHPIHIHVNHFQVISYNKYNGGFGILEDNWPLRDVQDRSICLYQRADYNEPSGRRKRSDPEIVNQAGTEPTQPIIDIRGDPLQYLGHEERYEADEGNTLGYARPGEWRDTILVPPLANITIRFIAHEHVGDVIMHCHILNHEDAGMMMVVEIVPKGESTDANITSGNAYPGTCRACDRYPFNNPETLGDCESTASDNTSISQTTEPISISSTASDMTTSGGHKMSSTISCLILVFIAMIYTFPA